MIICIRIVRVVAIRADSVRAIIRVSIISVTYYIIMLDRIRVIVVVASIVTISSAIVIGVVTSKLSLLL